METTNISRRNFIKTSAAATAGVSALMMSGNFAYAGGSDTIRVGLIGCGGRGTGAANDCVNGADGIEIYAMGDLFEDRLQASREQLKEHIGNSYQVADSRAFYGFDNYIEVMESGVDVVLLATPPGFRPIHLQAAVERGKHVFMEKPVAVDPDGARAVIRLGEEAREKGLSIVAGTQFRRQPSFVEAIDHLHDGMIGELVAAQEYYMTGPIWLRERKPGMSDMEWQCRNWYYFTWLSGDHIVEQFVHNIDTINWVFQGPPAKCVATGGRQVRVAPEYGHIYDHFAVEYEYPSGARVLAMCRQMEGVQNRVENRIVGTDGIADVNPDRSSIRSHSGDSLFRYPERGNNPYVQTHTDLIASIRENRPLNEARDVAESSLTAIMGREAAYTGQEITWDQMLNARQKLVPDSFQFGSLPVPPVPAPGVTTIERTEIAAAG